MADESEERGFTIVDKRGAGAPPKPGAAGADAPPTPGAPGADAPPALGAAAQSADSAGAAEGAGEAAAGAGGGASAAADAEAGAPPLPPVDFTSFALSLGTSALYHLGLVANPAAEDADARSEPNLPVARHTIDTLELLQQKTQGNLSEQESALLANLLSELRLRFVEVESRAAQQ